MALYKTQTFDPIEIEYNPPPQVNRSPPLPFGPSNDPYGGNWRPPTSFESDTAPPSGGSSGNSNTNDRNPTPNPASGDPMTTEELLRLIHELDVSGIQY